MSEVSSTDDESFCCSVGIDSEDSEASKARRIGQRKIHPSMWDGLVTEEVTSLPEGIDGLSSYKVKYSTQKNKNEILRADGRKWKKSSKTEWSSEGKLRYADCTGSHKCPKSD